MKKFLLFTFGALLTLSLWSAEPFQWKAETVNGQLVVSVSVAKGYYLNLDSLLTEIKDGRGILPPVVSLPPKHEITNPETGKALILPEGKWRWVYGGTPPYQVKVSFQGCQKGAPGAPAICLMPAEVTLMGASTVLGSEIKKVEQDFFRSWKVVKKHAGAMDKRSFSNFLLRRRPELRSKKTCLPTPLCGWSYC